MSGVEQSAPSVPSVADTPSSSRLHVTEADDAVGEAPMGGRKYLAMCWNRSGLGHAVFDKDSGVIGVGECREFESFLNVLQLKEDASPISIVVPTGSDARFVAAAKKPLSSGHAVDVSVVSRAEFVAESCAEKLAPDLHLTEPACRQYLERNVDMRAQQALRALSGLLSRVLGIAPITKVQQQCSSVLMAVDPTTLEALQVFKRVAHPSAHNGIGVPKEGLSVFGLLNTCRTRMGTEVLKQWLHSPTHDTAVLNARLSAIDVLVAPHNQDVVAHLRSHLRFLRNPDELLRRFQEYSRSVRHWQTLLQLLHSLPVVVEICRQLSQGAQAPVFRDIVNAFHEEQTALLFQRVADTVDVAASQCSGRVIVKWGVNDELDKHREAYEGLRGFLDVVAQSVSQDLQPFAHPISVDYYPQLGYFVTVGIAYFNSNLTTNLPNPNYQYQFKSEEKLFYKSSRMRELDEQYGDIYSAIVDMETEAVDELTGFVLEPHNVAVLGAVRPTATLDCLLAMATVSREERWCRPTVVGDSVLRIVEGRHPVQEKVVEAFVPNDTSSGTEGRICIVTGPNASGKSVYIKQVALIVFLAHIGCYVPAREAVVGATDRIFTRIRSRKASPSAKDCSAFASDLTDILDMMKYSTDKSLLVIDEFGKGTVTADGMALLAAVVRHFLAKGDACPRVLISTHYVEILNERLVPRCPLLAVSHMAVERDLMHEDEIVFRYKLRRGVSESSFALYCAAQAGVPQNVLARASFLHKLLKKVPPSAFKGILSSTPATHAAHLSVLRLLAGSLETCDAAALAQQIHRAVQ